VEAAAEPGSDGGLVANRTVPTMTLSEAPRDDDEDDDDLRRYQIFLPCSSYLQ